MHRKTIVLAIVSTLTVACSSVAVIGTDGPNGTGGHGGHPMSNSTTAMGGDGNAGGAATGGHGQGGATLHCGGFAGDTCDAASYCDYPDDLCGAADGSGICKPRPQACDDFYDPVCACDGTIYGNRCEAASTGVDVSNVGGCPLPAGSFPCGPKNCSIAGEYCLHQISDTDLPDTYMCMAMTCSVAVPTCNCVASETADCAGSCEVQAMGGVVVHCPGG